MKLKLLLKNPSIILMIAVCLASVVLLSAYSLYYQYSEQVLGQQQQEILDRSLEHTVQTVNRKLEEISLAAINVRSELRYVPMPPVKALTATARLELHEASTRMDQILEGIDDYIQMACFYEAEAGYVIMPDSVREESDLSRGLKTTEFTVEEIRSLWSVYTTGRLAVSNNGKQLAYVLSAGVNRDTGVPVRQLILILRKGFLQRLLTFNQPIQAKYTLESENGLLLDSLQLTQVDQKYDTYRYELAGNCILTAQIKHEYINKQVVQARQFYLLAVVVGLILVAAITIGACRMSVIPINQLISYIRSRYQGKEPEKQEGLLAIRTAVDDLWMMHQETVEKLQELQAASQWDQLTQLLYGSSKGALAWQGGSFVLMLFTLAELSESQLLSVVKRIVRQDQAYALLRLAEGISLMLEAKTSEESASFAERLLAALDDDQTETTRVAISACHHALEELPMAYREARLTMDCLFREMDMPVMSWYTCDLSQNVMLLDGEYLSRQQRFDRLILQGNVVEAQKCLKTLIADLFLENQEIVNSQIGRMHLEMVKYHMMGSLEYLYRSTAEDMELRQVGIRELLLCENHAQVLALMERQLSEVSQPEEIAAENSGGDDMLNRVKIYIREHFADPQLSVAQLGEVFELSPNALSKLFSRKAEMGVLQYIHKIRIEKACNLMLNTNLSLSEIAQQAGYTSQLTFTRSFKARYQMTPVQWRKMKEEI